MYVGGRFVAGGVCLRDLRVLAAGLQLEGLGFRLRVVKSHRNMSEHSLMPNPRMLPHLWLDIVGHFFWGASLVRTAVCCAEGRVALAEP